MKPTLVIGASDNPSRYSFVAITELREHGHTVYALALKKGKVADVEFETEWNPNWKVNTITMYISPKHQPPYYEQIIALQPRRVIFNPGTENSELADLLKENNIEAEDACTLVLLSIGQY